MTPSFLGTPSTWCFLSLWFNLGFSTKGLSYHIWCLLAKSLVWNPPICQNFLTVFSHSVSLPEYLLLACCHFGSMLDLWVKGLSIAIVLSSKKFSFDPIAIIFQRKVVQLNASRHVAVGEHKEFPCEDLLKSWKLNFSDTSSFHIGDAIIFLMPSKNGLDEFLMPTNWASGQILTLTSKLWCRQHQCKNGSWPFSSNLAGPGTSGIFPITCTSISWFPKSTNLGWARLVWIGISGQGAHVILGAFVSYQVNSIEKISGTIHSPAQFQPKYPCDKNWNSWAGCTCTLSHPIYHLLFPCSPLSLPLTIAEFTTKGHSTSACGKGYFCSVLHCSPPQRL